MNESRNCKVDNYNVSLAKTESKNKTKDPQVKKQINTNTKIPGNYGKVERNHNKQCIYSYK